MRQGVPLRSRQRRRAGHGESAPRRIDGSSGNHARVPRRSVQLLLELLPALYGAGSPRGRRARLAGAFRTLSGAVGCRIVKAGAVAAIRPGEALVRVPLGAVGSVQLEAVLRFRGRAPARSERERAALLVPHARRLLGLPGPVGLAALGAAEIVGRVSTEAGTIVVLRAPTDPLATPAAARLSARERAVCLLVSEGLRDREIAATLGTSPRTVANQLRAASRKLDVRSRREVASVMGLDAAGPRRRARRGEP